MALLVLAVLLTYFATRQVAYSSLEQAQDQSLSAVAQVIADSLVLDGDSIDFNLPYPAFEVLAYQGQEALYFRVIGVDGTTQAGYSDLPTNRKAASTASYRGQSVRIYQIDKQVRDDLAPVKILIAQTQDELRTTVANIAQRAALGLIAIFGVIAALVYTALMAGLRPLRTIESALSKRQDDDFSALELEAPAEIQGLVATLNRSLGKHRRLLERSRVFIAQATHQIKTPIASLSAEADLLVARTPEPLKDEVAQLAIHARQTSRLAEQLLTRAALRYREGLQHKRIQPLYPLLSSVADSFEALAEQKDVQINVVPTPEHYLFDAVTLREALVCLVDNALKASPSLADISISSSQIGTDLQIRVIDQGLGFSDGPSDGTGIGLELVNGVAEAHGGSFEHYEQDGETQCVLSLPQSA